MNKLLLSLSLISVVFFISCQKDMTAKDNAAGGGLSDKSAPDKLAVNSVVSSAHWYGSYTDPVCNDPNGACDPDAAGEVLDLQMIKNGVAQDPILSSYTFTYSNITFNIPYNYTIDGDSVIFQTVAENTATDGGFSDYDVVLQIIGSQHSAELHFVADAASQQYNQYYIGNTLYSNLPQLVHYFGSFQTIKWVMKQNGTAAYINGKLVYKFNYGATNHIGRINTINVAGKGYIVVNSVNLLNSYTNKKIMTENFNTDGQSHTIFY